MAVATPHRASRWLAPTLLGGVVGAILLHPGGSGGPLADTGNASQTVLQGTPAEALTAPLNAARCRLASGGSGTTLDSWLVNRVDLDRELQRAVVAEGTDNGSLDLPGSLVDWLLKNGQRLEGDVGLLQVVGARIDQMRLVATIDTSLPAPRVRRMAFATPYGDELSSITLFSTTRPGGGRLRNHLGDLPTTAVYQQWNERGELTAELFTVKTTPERFLEELSNHGFTLERVPSSEGFITVTPVGTTKPTALLQRVGNAEGESSSFLVRYL